MVARGGISGSSRLTPGVVRALEREGVDLGSLDGGDGVIGPDDAPRVQQAIDELVRKDPAFAQRLGELAHLDALREQLPAGRLPLGEPSTASRALVVPESQRRPALSLDVNGLYQYAYARAESKPGRPVDGDTACYSAAKRMVDDFNKDHHRPAPILKDRRSAIQVATMPTEFPFTMSIDPDQARLARMSIDAMLESGKPVLVGVGHSGSVRGDNAPTTPEHFVVIRRRGYDESGRLFYEFKDVAEKQQSVDPSAPTDEALIDRFYVDAETGALFKEGDRQARYVKDRPYCLMQVRIYGAPEVPRPA